MHNMMRCCLFISLLSFQNTTASEGNGVPILKQIFEKIFGWKDNAVTIEEVTNKYRSHGRNICVHNTNSNILLAMAILAQFVTFF